MLNQAWRQRLRRARFLLCGALGVAIIALAVLMAVAQLLLPLAAHYPGRVAALLASRLDRPVSFEAMDGHWQPSGPLLVLHQVRIGGADGAPPLELPAAEVKLDFGALLWPSRHWVNLRLRGLKLALERDAQGTWHVTGFGAARAGGANASLDDLPGNLWLSGLQLEIADAGSGRNYALLADPLRLSNSGRTLRFAGTLRRRDMAQAVHVVGRFRTDGSSGRLHVAGSGVDMGALLDGLEAGGDSLRGGHGDFALWLDWCDARLAAASARLDLEEVILHGAGGDVAVPTLQGLAGYQRTASGARVLYADGQDGAARVEVTGSGAATAVAARARHLDLGALLPLAALLPQLPPGEAHWLVEAHPRGMLRQAGLRWSKQHGLESLFAGFEGLGFDAVGKRPGIDRLDGIARGDAAAISLELPEQATTLRFPHTFREPFVLSKLGGTVVAWHADDAWHLGTDALVYVGTGFAGRVRGEVALHDAGGAPFADIYATVHSDVPAAKLFWPIDSMAPSAVEWLDRALVAGTVDGAAVIRGDLGDWPFRNHLGRFEARGVIDRLTLDYSPHWPRAENVKAIASFVDNGMLVQADAGEALGVHTDVAVGAIPDFADSELVLNVQGKGTGADLLGFVRKSPIGDDHADALKGLKLGGRGEFDFSLVMPLKHSADFTLAGQAQLHEADLVNPDWNLQLDKLGGTLRFDGHGFSATQLDTVFHGVPSKLDIAVGGDTGDPQRAVSASLRGRFAVAQLIEGYDDLAPLADITSGSADFDIGFAVANDAAEGVSSQILTVDSDLHGIAFDLPAPLDKAAGATLPLRLQLGLPFAGNTLQVALGDVLRARARLPDGADRPLALDVRLGDSAPTTVPERGIRVEGHAATLDVSGWTQRALAGDGGGGLTGVDVSADTAILFGTRFQKMHLQVNPQPQQTTMTVDGEQIAGKLTLPATDLARRGIVARFDRLYWPREPEPPAAGASSPAPSSSSAVEPPAPAQTAQEDAAVVAATGIDPASLPPLHLWVGDLRFGKARLGDARFESWPTPHGMHIDQLRTHSKSVHIGASGDWTGTAQASRTHMKIDFGAESLGRMLDAFGFDGLFTGGQTHALLDATWPGSPSSFAFAHAEGTLAVDVGKGRIPEVQPGVGRLFGLMSLAELPRRLSLDFGDVFGKGFGFDSIKGDFRLAGGDAWTENLAVKGPAADISVKGRTGLRARDYDQQVWVVPHVGNSLPVVGAVVGGPVGAAAGLAVQGLLGKGLNKAASARYRISGSWDKPDITLLEKHVPPPAAPAPPSSAPSPASSSPAPSSSATTPGGTSVGVPSSPQPAGSNP